MYGLSMHNAVQLESTTDMGWNSSIGVESPNTFEMMSASICNDTNSMNSILCSKYDAIYCMASTNVSIDTYSKYKYGLLEKRSTQEIYCKLSMKIITCSSVNV